MKTKILYKEFQIHNVPFERVEFDAEKQDLKIFLDDVNEKRWLIKIKGELALKIIDIDICNLNFLKGGDFHDDCYIKSYGNDVFRSFIMEVENSKWIKEIRKARRSSQDGSMENARHFLITCYDYVIEFIAQDIELEEVK